MLLSVEALFRGINKNNMPTIKLLFLILLLISQAIAQADQLIIEPDEGRLPLLKAIEGAEKSIHLAMYGWTDPVLLNAVLQQKKAGKEIKIILEPHPYEAEKENYRAIKFFNEHHIDWQPTLPSFHLTHQKTLIVDGKNAIVMTFNFTRSTFKNDRNFGLIIDDKKQVNAIENIFLSDWMHKKTMFFSQTILLSPDNSRDLFLSHLRNAKKNILIYASSISDYQIIGALAQAAKNKVDVKILTSANMNQKKLAYLKRAGVSIKHANSYRIHAKAMAIDHKLAIIGSINLTASSLDLNRELSIVTTDSTVLTQLENIFNTDWQAT